MTRGTVPVVIRAVLLAEVGGGKGAGFVTVYGVLLEEQLHFLSKVLR